MLKKNLVLGSVATLALAVAMSPAFAQSPPQYPNFSLPWERVATDSLNAQQASEPGIIASTTTTTLSDTSGVVASTDTSSDIIAYNEALADQQSKQQAYDSSFSDYNSKLSDFQSKESSYQQSWQDYQSKLNAYNQRMQGWSMWHSAAPATVVTTVPSTVVSEEIISRPAVTRTVTEETFTRPVVRDTFERRQVVREEKFTQPVVHEETVMRPKTVWVPETRQVVRNETVTRPVVHEEVVRRPVVTQEVVTRPVVREQIVERPVIRERIVERPIIREEVFAANTPVVDEWVSIYPHHERLVVFNTVSNADIALRGTPVMDRSGQIVGSFQHMTFADGGIPEALIMLNDNKTVAIADQHLRFDPMANMVIADLSYGQMDSMPARF